MEILYDKDSKIFCRHYTEIYIPLSYFDDGVASNRGASVETNGMVYLKAFPKGEAASPLKLLNLPTIIHLQLYNFRDESIKIHDKVINVMTLEYLPDAYIMHQTLECGRHVGEQYLNMEMAGKLPRTLNYSQLINNWWRNIEIANVNFRVPSKIYEMILASTYRNPHNQKERYGQYYGSQTNPNGYDYVTNNVRSVVKNLSTFSGMVFEDIGAMITNGINNANSNDEEPVSPLEKIIYY